jgi:phospholipase C
MPDPIKHVVLLMLENRSFDHILGDCAKVTAEMGAPGGANIYDGRTFPQAPGAARILAKDPGHDTKDVLIQLGGKAGVPANGGFVLDYARSYGHLTDAELLEVMKYHAEGSLPAMHMLAGNFMLCLRWFASVPGPTWTNRLFALSGTSLGRVSMPNGIMNLNLHWYDQSTVFDRLNEKGRSWKVYFDDVPLSLLFVHQWAPENAARHQHMQDFYQDAAGPEEKFPAFALIEPAYMQPGANDGHPPHDILDCDALVGKVYNAIRGNEALWESTLLVVVFDEHGGFYDRVSPPVAVPPDHHDEEYSFDRLGPRVPAILVSPHVANGWDATDFDHTSLLRYLQEKWGLGDLGARTASAHSIGALIQPADPSRMEALPGAVPPLTTTSPMLAPKGAPVAVEALTDHQAALVALSHTLEAMTDEDPNVVAARSRQVLTGPQSQIDAAVDRVESFLRDARDKQERRSEQAPKPQSRRRSARPAPRSGRRG